MKSIKWLAYLAILLVLTSATWFTVNTAMATTGNDKVKREATTTHSPPILVVVEVQLCTPTSSPAREKSAIEVTGTANTDLVEVQMYASTVASDKANYEGSAELTDGIEIWLTVSSNSDPAGDKIIWQNSVCTTNGGSPPTAICWTACRETDQQAITFHIPIALVYVEALTGSTNTWMSADYLTTEESIDVAILPTEKVWCPNIGYDADLSASVVATMTDATPCPRIEEVWQPNIGFQQGGPAVCGDGDSFLSALSDYPNPFA